MKVKVDNLELATSVINISEASDDPNIKTVTMLIHKCDVPNGNGLDFKLEYTEEFMNTLVDKPVVAKYYEYEDDLGSHEAVFDKNGKITELKTIAIGTITEVWIDDFEMDDGTTVKALYAKAVLWSYKYPKIVACIEKLFEDGNAESSVEVAIYEWGDNPTQEYRYGTKFTYLANCLLGSTVDPADEDAGVISISQISKAVWEDTHKTKGGQLDVSEKNDKPKIEVAENKGFKVTYRGVLETCDLTFDQIYNAVYNTLNPVDGMYRNYNYWIDEIYPNYVIAVDWDYDNVAYRIGYTVSGDIVSLSPKEQWIKGRLGFIPDGVSNDDLLETQAEEDAEDKTIEDLTAKVTDLEGQVQDLTAQLSEKTATLEQYEQDKEIAAKQAKRVELSEKYSKLISKEAFGSERVVNALDNLNESELQAVVVDELAGKVNLNSKQEETVVVNARATGDLLQTGKYDYLFQSKKD